MRLNAYSSVRVRGIYATALSSILLDHGYLITDASDVLKNRLSRPVMDGPAHVTIKSLDDDRDSILIVGYPWEAGLEVEKVVTKSVKYLVVNRGKLGLATVVDVISRGDCKAEGPGGLEVLIEPPCPETGSVIRGYVVREGLRKNEKPVVKRGVAAIGLYASIYAPGIGVSFSEHIRDQSRITQLESLARRMTESKSVHIRFRSNSKLGDIAEITEEIESLMMDVEKMLSETPSNEPRVIRKGEYISLATITSAGKLVLDDIRSKVCPTVYLHHSLKSGGDYESYAVDVLEEAMRMNLADKKASLALLSRIASNLVGKRILLEHRYPDGEKISLGPFTLEGFHVDEERIDLTLHRVFVKPGVLDGLGVEKKPGDYSITRVRLDEWSIIHEYYRVDGKLIGVYANINTPPELSSKGLRYIDLYVDVVKKPGEEPRVIDSEALEKALEEGLLTSHLYEKAVEEVNRISRRLSNMYK